MFCEAPSGEIHEDYSSTDPGTEHYEHRVFKLSNPDQQMAVSQFLDKTFIPALNRLQIDPVGAFKIADTTEGFDIHLIIPFPSLAKFQTVYSQLYEDAQFLQSGEGYLEISDPENKAYDRIESRLLVAFDSMPAMAIPEKAVSDERFFELRSYESFSELKGRKKVSMFDEGGEVGIFKRLGSQPVFFGEAITGNEMPNLVYMITHDNQAKHDELWSNFRSDPAWVAIKDLPEYANTVSKIYKYYLKALDCSQIK
jgi:hypothetical protein